MGIIQNTRKGIQLLNKQRKTFASFCKECRGKVTYNIQHKMQIQKQDTGKVLETSDKEFYEAILCDECVEKYHRSL